jgi:hypothetical protein
MPVELISKIEPKNSGLFPMVEDVHFEGGFQVRTDISDRDSIPTLNRKEGMLAYVVSTTTTYRLVGGITNLDWVAVSTPSGLLTLTTDDALVEGDLVVINTSGNVELGNASAINSASVIGASAGAFGASTTATINSTLGNLIPVRFGAAPAAGLNGSSVFLSTTDGLATTDPPSSPGEVVYFIGILQGADGATTIPPVIFQPREVTQIG